MTYLSYLITALSGSISRNFSSSINNCIIGTCNAAVRNNFAENKPSWKEEYNLENAPDACRNNLKQTFYLQ